MQLKFLFFLNSSNQTDWLTKRKQWNCYFVSLLVRAPAKPTAANEPTDRPTVQYTFAGSLIFHSILSSRWVCMHFSSVLFSCYLDDFGFDAVIYNDLLFGRFSWCHCMRCAGLSSDISSLFSVRQMLFPSCFMRILIRVCESVGVFFFQIHFLFHFFVVPFLSSSTWICIHFFTIFCLFCSFTWLLVSVHPWLRCAWIFNTGHKMSCFIRIQNENE